MFKLQLNLFVLAAGITMCANSQNSYIPPNFSDPKRMEKLQQVFPEIEKVYKNYADKNHFPAYAFGIMVDGKLVYAGAGGYIDAKKKISSSPKAMFRIASMTKSFTAMAVLQLRDAGKLKLDDPISFYIPEWKNQTLTNDTPEITIRDLLTHSTGLPTEDSWGDRQLNMSNNELILLINKGFSLANPSGIVYEYSNLAYVLLGLVIDRVAGKSYQNYIAENIWYPLEMNQATWEFSKIPANELVHGYKWMNGTWHEEKLLHDGAFGAMGGMITSVQALSHYVGLHQMAWPPRDDVEVGPLRRSSIREMQQAWRFVELNVPYKFVNGYECVMTSAYGYGLRWLRDCRGRTYIGHGGGLPGFGSNWFIMPDYGIGVILLANNTYAPANEINLQVLESLIKEAKLKPRQLPPSLILQDRKSALIKILPDWLESEKSNIFADNFFLDTSIDARKKESNAFFKKMGKIIQVDELIAENQLNGSFIIKGEKANLKILMTLTPQNPALIQTVQIKEVEK